ncbi:MAG: hypothetical protein BGN88_01265 [Clostridiales bacterium 43-6]|nr:MAG: hypothetical protein BGN88_01265 [Clostridiales bacterium 43-6]
MDKAFKNMYIYCKVIAVNVKIEYSEAVGMTLYGHQLTHVKTLPFLSVVTPVAGHYEVTVDEKGPFIVRPGCCFVAPPDVVQHIVHHQPEVGQMQAKWVFIKATIDELVDFSGYFDVPVYLDEQASRSVISSIDQMLTLDGSDRSEIKRHALAFFILSELSSGASVRGYSSDYSTIAPALKLIFSRLDSDLSVHLLAMTCGMSDANFYRLFKNATGETPHAFVRKKRLSKACSILLTTNLKLYDIAMQTGFTDEFHLSREFKKGYGDSPYRYKKSLEGAYQKTHEIL